jgi:hypothetical protein
VGTRGRELRKNSVIKYYSVAICTTLNSSRSSRDALAASHKLYTGKCISFLVLEYILFLRILFFFKRFQAENRVVITITE